MTSARLGYRAGTATVLAILLGGACDAADLPRLRVSDDQRFLVTEQGEPFFYLSDTAWGLFQRLTREEAERYLQDRARKRFTVIKAAVSLWWIPRNAYGEAPFADHDPLRPNEPYWGHIDWVVRRAGALGLYVAMVVGDNLVAQGEGADRQLLKSADMAREFGRWTGTRYRDDANMIWILGGDQKADPNEAVWRALADGIAEGVAGAVEHDMALMSYHPCGWRSSSEWFQGDRWLDFNMIQSGHTADRSNYDLITEDYALTPVKPTMDDEPAYEGAVDEWDVRKKAYWALFAGAHGHTYGAFSVFQFSKPEDKPGEMAGYAGRRPYWPEALDYPGSGQMQHARSLMESRPMLTRVPDQSILVSDPGTGGDHVRATRDEDGSYAFVYIPSGRRVAIDMSKISGDKVNTYWYDPRTGAAELFGRFANTGTRQFAPPARGAAKDWVLVLDDSAKGFPPPGAADTSVR